MAIIRRYHLVGDDRLLQFLDFVDKVTAVLQSRVAEAEELGEVSMV